MPRLIRTKTTGRPPRRRLLRLGTCVLLAFGGVTCTDAPTGPGRGHGGAVALRLAPSFSTAAAAAFDGLGAFGLSVNNVHIHIDHPPALAFDARHHVGDFLAHGGGRSGLAVGAGE